MGKTNEHGQSPLHVATALGIAQYVPNVCMWGGSSRRCHVTIAKFARHPASVALSYTLATGVCLPVES